ncbi:MAG: lysoplasmalogenase [Phototrophicales bacterium]|nr:lysoplasmalogenase [Phototrophicales bacterium]
MNFLMLGLLVLWAFLLLGGWVMGSYNPAQTHKVATWRRMGSSVTLVIAGWLWMVGHGGNLAMWIALGMSFGFLGDLFMAGLVIKGEKSVLGGMSAFGLGHVCYIIGILGMNSVNIAVLVGMLMVAVALWYVVVYRTAKEISVLHYAALPYALLLASTAGFAGGVALTNSAFILMAIGAVLFLISDLILATQLFNGVHFKGIGDVVWLTYGPAQMLIVYAIPLSVGFVA